jgi:Tfp pilus assembly protein PilN
MATDPKKVLNLIPLSEKELRQKRRLEIIKLAANITFVITLIIGIFCANLYTINKKTELLQNKLNSLKPTIADILKTKKEHEKLCKQLEFFKTNFFQQPSYLVVLREIQLVLPKNIWLNSITLKDTKLQNMEGFCLGSAADVLRRLDMSRLFYKVEFKGAIVKSKFNGFDVDKFNLKANILKNIKSIPLGGK